ncbi:hypothetical protein HZU67_04870 [Apis mellifera carnica]|nr:hypothetical protein HZU67_04870 [Apis mellifera carnica]
MEEVEEEEEGKEGKGYKRVCTPFETGDKGGRRNERGAKLRLVCDLFFPWSSNPLASRGKVEWILGRLESSD